MPGRDREQSGRNLSVLDLMDTGTIDPWVAAFLWETISRRSSLIVIAGPSGVGKTTLLTALTEFLPTTERLLLVRGIFDPLRFLDDPATDPSTTTVMVNEISPHLPIYLWGPGVGRLLTSPRPLRVFATAHADSAQDLVAQLAGYPLRIPLHGVARLDMVVRLEALRDGGAVRRAVTEVTALGASDRDGIVLQPFLTDSGDHLDHDAVEMWLRESPAGGDWASIATRHKVLTSLGWRSDAPGVSEPPLREVLETAYARALGDT